MTVSSHINSSLFTFPIISHDLCSIISGHSPFRTVCSWNTFNILLPFSVVPIIPFARSSVYDFLLPIFSHIGQHSPFQGALHNLPFLPYNCNPPIDVSSIVHSWFILSVDQHPSDTLFISLTETLNHWGFVAVVLDVEFCSCNAVSPKHRRFPGT